MKKSTDEEIETARLDPTFGDDVDRFQKHTDWVDDHATYAIEPKTNDYQRVVFFIHGGGYARNLQYAHIKTCFQLSNKLNAQFYIPLHPVIPQHRADECFAFLRQAYDDMCGNE